MQLVIRRGSCGFGFTVFGSSPVQVCRVDHGQLVNSRFAYFYLLTNLRPLKIYTSGSKAA